MVPAQHNHEKDAYNGWNECSPYAAKRRSDHAFGDIWATGIAA
jgi:hypothetical protein